MRSTMLHAALALAVLASGCAVDLSFEKRDAWPDAVDAPDAGDADGTDPGDADTADADAFDPIDDEAFDPIDDEASDPVDDDATDVPVDVDCDSSTGGFFLLYGPTRVSGGAGTPSASPAMVWDGAGYGIAWQDRRHGNDEVYFARRDPAGGVALAEMRLTTTGTPSVSPAIAWEDDGYHIAFVDPGLEADDSIQYIGVSGAGVPDALPAEVASSDGIDLAGPVVSGRTAGLATAWDSGTDVLMAKQNTAGHRMGAVVTIDDASGASRGVSMAWTGSIFGLVWTDDRDGNEEIYAAIVADDCTVLATGIRLTNDASASTSPSVAWNGTHFAVAWIDARGGTPGVWMCLFGTDGAKVGSDVQVPGVIGEAASPSIAASGSIHGLAWAESIGGEWGVMFAIVDDALAPAGPALRVSPAGSDGTMPGVVASDPGFGVAWEGDSTGAAEVMLAILGPWSCP